MEIFIMPSENKEVTVLELVSKLNSIQDELDDLKKQMQSLIKSNNIYVPQGHGHALTDEKLIELLNNGYTTKQIVQWTADNGGQYTVSGIRYRIRKLITEGKTAIEGKDVR